MSTNIEIKFDCVSKIQLFVQLRLDKTPTSEDTYFIKNFNNVNPKKISLSILKNKEFSKFEFEFDMIKDIHDVEEFLLEVLSFLNEANIRQITIVYKDKTKFDEIV